MQIIIENNYESMSRVAVNLLMAHMLKPKRVNLAITAGSTPKRMYELLVEEVRHKSFFDKVHYYNFDEVPVFNEKGYGLTMQQLDRDFYKPAAIDSNQLEILNCENYLHFGEKIIKDGGLDLILMGIGQDGHFCGNLPYTSDWHDEIIRIQATKEHKKLLLALVNGNESLVPDYWITFGPKTVMKARQLILFANGEHKADIIKRAFTGPITPEIPASILQLHPNLILLLDKAAASKLSI